MTPSEENCRGHFYFDPHDPIYEEHFPGAAVVPGSLIIDAFIQAAAGRRNACPTFTIRIDNFRFKRFITPGKYAFSIQSRPDGRLACTLFDGASAAVSGTL